METDIYCVAPERRRLPLHPSIPPHHTRDLQWLITYVWGKRLNQKCHEEQSLQNNQFARKETIGVDRILQKVIKIDLQKVSGGEEVLVDYDATSC